MQNKYKKVVAIDTDTGEIIGNTFLKQGEELVLDSKKSLTDKQKTFLNKENGVKKENEKLGGYIMVSYVSNELLFNKLDLKQATVSRIIYLSTYIDYSDREANLLVKYGQNKEVLPMTKKDIKRVMNLTDTTFKSFFKEVKEKGLLYEVEGKFYLNNEYFHKGNENTFNNYARVYIGTTRKLYEGCKTTKHRQLSYLFALIPYINYNTNVIAFNPEETDIRKIKGMNLKEITGLLGLGTEKNNVSNLNAQLKKFLITFNGITYSVFRKVTLECIDGNIQFVAVNPLIIWKGNDLEARNKTLNSLIWGFDHGIVGK